MMTMTTTMNMKQLTIDNNTTTDPIVNNCPSRQKCHYNTLQHSYICIPFRRQVPVVVVCSYIFFLTTILLFILNSNMNDNRYYCNAFTITTLRNDPSSNKYYNNHHHHQKESHLLSSSQRQPFSSSSSSQSLISSSTVLYYTNHNNVSYNILDSTTTTSTTTNTKKLGQQQQLFSERIIIPTNNKDDITSPYDTIIRIAQERYQNKNDKKNTIEFYVMTFPSYCHRPLGCTIEESLASSIITTVDATTTTEADTTTTTTTTDGTSSTSVGGGPDIFVSKIVSSSYADQAGIQMGDVVIGITTNTYSTTSMDIADDNSASTFTTKNDNDDNSMIPPPMMIRNVMSENIDAIKRYISTFPDEDKLQLLIVRGSTVYNDHERELVNIVSNPNYDQDSITEKGMLNFIKGGYYNYDNNNNNNGSFSTKKDTKIERIRGNEYKDDDDDNLEEECNPFDDADCLVDNMYNMWAEMEDFNNINSDNNNNNKSNNKKEPVSSSSDTTVVKKPWSSRSSPSGTYVRDPTTGQIKKMDD